MNSLSNISKEMCLSVRFLNINQAIKTKQAWNHGTSTNSLAAQVVKAAKEPCKSTWFRHEHYLTILESVDSFLLNYLQFSNVYIFYHFIGRCDKHNDAWENFRNYRCAHFSSLARFALYLCTWKTGFYLQVLLFSIKRVEPKLSAKMEDKSSHQTISTTVVIIEMYAIRHGSTH